MLRPQAAVLVTAVLVVGLALARDAMPVSAGVGLVLAAGVAAAPPAAGITAVLVCAHLRPLLLSAAIGPLSPVDLMALALVARVGVTRHAALIGSLRSVHAAGVALLVAGGAAATATAAEGSAVTAFLRLTAYLAVGVAAWTALDRRGRDLVLAAFVGVALGDATAALAGITGTLPSSLPVGRYTGTLEDPAQFGIPVAAALLVVLVARRLLPSTLVRLGVAGVLALGLAGSGTRAAWGAAVLAAVGLLAVVMARRGVAASPRFAAGCVLGAVVVAGALLVTLGADLVGLQAASARVRLDSYTAAWEALVTRPLDPTGLGNIPGRFQAYNTWLAMAVALGPVAAVGLLLFVGASLRRAARSSDLAWLAVGLVFVAATMTENTVFAGSSLTLTWFVLCGAMLSMCRRGERPGDVAT